MTWIVDIDTLGVESAEPPDVLAIAFDVTYPGETWCRSLVLITSELAYMPEYELVSRARDALIEVLEAAGEPVSVEIRLTPTETVMLASGRPGG
jgi:hypothetical protein